MTRPANTRNLAGLTWLAHSPSFLEHATMPLWLAWDGSGWRVAVRGVWGARSFLSRMEAAQLVANEVNGSRT